MASQRLYSLDFLRASMMLLGLVLHSAVSYGSFFPGGTVWPYADSSNSEAFDFIVDFIHIWRMPLFFVIAGFFSALLLTRRGYRSLALNRATRIGVPFIFGWIILYPMILSGFLFAIVSQQTGPSTAWAQVVNYFKTGEFPTQVSHIWYLFYDSAAHLWFLYYLMLFYIAGLGLHCFAQKLPNNIRRIPLNLFGKVIGSRWNFLLFSIPVALILSTMEHGTLKTSTSFVPDFWTFSGYFLFFSFGWLLYLRREFLFNWTRHPWIQVSIGLGLSIPHFLAVRASSLGGETPTTLWVAAVTGALVIWLFTFGLTGLCMRYLERPIPAVRYLVDASYWLYLVHLPMTIWFPGLMANLQWSPWIKSSLVLLLTTLISLGSYDLFVRNTFIGKLLNGRRYTRGFPPPEDAPREVPESAVPSFAPRS